MIRGPPPSEPAATPGQPQATPKRPQSDSKAAGATRKRLWRLFPGAGECGLQVYAEPESERLLPCANGPSSIGWRLFSALSAFGTGEASAASRRSGGRLQLSPSKIGFSWPSVSGPGPREPQTFYRGQFPRTSTPVAGDSLQFPLATQTTVQNDLPAGFELGGLGINPGSGGCVTITGNSFSLPDGGTLTLESGAATISANFTLGGELCGRKSGMHLTVSGILSESIPGNGWLDVNGGGTLVVSGSADSYTGGTEIDNGSHLTLAGGDNRLPAAGDITLYGGVVNLGGFGRTTTGTLWFQNDSASDPNTVQDGTLVLDNSTTEQGINACYGSGTVSATSTSKVAKPPSNRRFPELLIDDRRRCELHALQSFPARRKHHLRWPELHRRHVCRHGV